MTSEERKLFAELRETIRELRESNAEFKEGMVARLEATEKKVEVGTFYALGDHFVENSFDFILVALYDI